MQYDQRLSTVYFESLIDYITAYTATWRKQYTNQFVFKRNCLSNVRRISFHLNLFSTSAPGGQKQRCKNQLLVRRIDSFLD